jgi:hypothetical protein
VEYNTPDTTLWLEVRQTHGGAKASTGLLQMPLGDHSTGTAGSLLPVTIKPQSTSPAFTPNGYLQIKDLSMSLVHTSTDSVGAAASDSGYRVALS